MLPQFVWLCGWDTDGSISIMGESNPGYGEYIIYAYVLKCMGQADKAFDIYYYYISHGFA